MFTNISPRGNTKALSRVIYSRYGLHLIRWRFRSANEKIRQTILECLLIEIVFEKERLWKRKCLNKDFANAKKDITPKNVFRVIFTKKKDIPVMRCERSFKIRRGVFPVSLSLETEQVSRV